MITTLFVWNTIICRFRLGHQIKLKENTRDNIDICVDVLNLY